MKLTYLQAIQLYVVVMALFSISFFIENPLKTFFLGLGAGLYGFVLGAEKEDEKL